VCKIDKRSALEFSSSCEHYLLFSTIFSKRVLNVLIFLLFSLSTEDKYQYAEEGAKAI
jgi:hypothetical protein